MLIKTKKNEKGEQLYQRVFMSSLTDGCKKHYFEEGTLSEVKSFPSTRKQMRYGKRSEKQHNNRRTTNSRINQIVNGKTIRHETEHILNAKKIIVGKRYKIK